MRNDAADALESLCRLVADERGALRAGDLASLPAIASAKEALLSRLTSSPEALDLRRLARLKAEAQGLGHILQAAARGYIDDVIMPHETRRWLIRSLELARTKRVRTPSRKHGNIPL